jgi:hypothetical protein
MVQSVPAMNQMPAPGQQGGGTESNRARHRLQPRAEGPVKRIKSFASFFDDAEFQRLIK